MSMTAGSDTGRPFRRPSLTTWSLAALVGGLLLGMFGHASHSPLLGKLGDAVKPVGDLWIAALLMTVLPLVITQVLAAITGGRGAGSVAALGVRAVLLFVVLLTAAGLFTLLLAPSIIAQYRTDTASIASLHAATSPPEAGPRTAGTGSIEKWIGSLIPRNIFEAAVHGDFLALLLFSVLFATAAARLPDEYRAPLASLFQGLAQAMLLCVRWILRVTPAGVFALTYVLALKAGGEAVGMLTVYVAIVCGLILLFTLLLYPVTAVLGRTTIRTFARAVAPAQLVAVSTRSSVAALPALVEGGRRHMRLPASSTSFVLPFSVSLFKVNRSISSLVKLFFLAHVYGIQLRPGAVAAFLATEMILSFGAAGIPLGGMSLKALPAYFAAGVPVEGVLILDAVETIPDIFKTLLNVTGDMSVATLLSRSSRAPGAPVSAEDPLRLATEETA
jgi:proton glutamate symport protein